MRLCPSLLDGVVPRAHQVAARACRRPARRLQGLAAAVLCSEFMKQLTVQIYFLTLANVKWRLTDIIPYIFSSVIKCLTDIMQCQKVYSFFLNLALRPRSSAGSGLGAMLRLARAGAHRPRALRLRPGGRLQRRRARGARLRHGERDSAHSFYPRKPVEKPC